MKDVELFIDGSPRLASGVRFSLIFSEVLAVERPSHSWLPGFGELQLFLNKIIQVPSSHRPRMISLWIQQGTCPWIPWIQQHPRWYVASTSPVGRCLGLHLALQRWSPGHASHERGSCRGLESPTKGALGVAGRKGSVPADPNRSYQGKPSETGLFPSK